jgi:TP53 regulating kinase-like protein
MEFIDFPSVRDCIDTMTLTDMKTLGSMIGKEVAMIHNQDCIHGDLTTSNMLYRNELVWIDFGLSYISTLAEDKAVDLYVLERAIQSTHPNIADPFFEIILESYSKDIDRVVLLKFEQVRLRGRKRSQIG